MHQATHGEIADDNVFNVCPANRFKREATTVVQDTVGDVDVLEAAIRFRAALDAPNCLALIGVGLAHKGAIEQCSKRS